MHGPDRPPWLQRGMSCWQARAPPAMAELHAPNRVCRCTTLQRPHGVKRGGEEAQGLIVSSCSCMHMFAHAICTYMYIPQRAICRRCYCVLMHIWPDACKRLRLSQAMPQCGIHGRRLMGGGV